MSALAISIEFMAPLVGVFVGTLLALWLDRRNANRRKQERAEVLLKSLLSEIQENNQILRQIRPAFKMERWGKTFYLSTNAWETAVAGGDLADVIGIQLANQLSQHYGRFQKITYYVDLLTRLWFAPDELQGAEEMRRGFHDHISRGMTDTINHHQTVETAIKGGLPKGK